MVFLKNDSQIVLNEVGKFVCSDINQARVNQLKRLIWPTKKNLETLKRKERLQLKGLNLEVLKGDKVYICATPKSGKSLIAKLISGMLQPSIGTINSKGRILYFQSKLNLNRPLMTLEQYGWTLVSLLEVLLNEANEIIKDAMIACELEGRESSRLYDIETEKIKDFQNYIQLRSQADTFVFEDVLPLRWTNLLEKLFETRTIILITAGWIPPKPFQFNKTLLLTNEGLTPLADINYAPMLCSFPHLLTTFIQEGEAAFKKEVQNARAPKIDNINKVNSRKGSGTLRFSGFLIRDEEGNITDYCVSGENYSFDLYYELLQIGTPLTEGHCTLLFESEPDNRVLGLAMLSQMPPFKNLHAMGRISIKVKKFPLVQGFYNLVASLTVNGSLSDKVNEGWTVEVKQGKFYGHNKAPLPKWGRSMIDYTWSYERDSKPNETQSPLDLRYNPADSEQSLDLIYISAVSFVGPSPGVIRTGDPVQIKVFHQALKSWTLQNNHKAWIRISLSCPPNYKSPFTSFVLQADVEPVIGLAEYGAFVATIPCLNLIAQDYRALIDINIDGLPAVRLLKSLEFTISDSNFLGGPLKPSNTWGPLAFPATWELFKQKPRLERFVESDDSHELSQNDQNDDDIMSPF